MAVSSPSTPDQRRLDDVLAQGMAEHMTVGLVTAQADKAHPRAVTGAPVERQHAFTDARFEKFRVTTVSVLQVDGEDDLHVQSPWSGWRGTGNRGGASTPAPHQGTTMEEVPNARAYTQHIARPLRRSVDFEALSSERAERLLRLDRSH